MGGFEGASKGGLKGGLQGRASREGFKGRKREKKCEVLNPPPSGPTLRGPTLQSPTLHFF